MERLDLIFPGKERMDGVIRRQGDWGSGDGGDKESRKVKKWGTDFDANGFQTRDTDTDASFLRWAAVGIPDAIP